jgi:hypothetical protein
MIFMMRMNCCWVLRFFATIDVLIPNSRWKIDFVARGSEMLVKCVRRSSKPNSLTVTSDKVVLYVE